MVRSIAFALVFVLGAAAVAAAQTADEQAACTDDAFRFCQHTIPDRERTFQCLVANKAAISAACYTVLARFLPAEQSKKKMAAPRNKQGPLGKGPLDLSPTTRR